MSYPDIALTGEDIHNAYCRVEPDEARPWGSLNYVAIRRYEALAVEINRELNARLAWFETEKGVNLETIMQTTETTHETP